MWADDTNYAVIKNGVVAVSGTGPAIRVDGNRLVIRDGPQETPPLCLTRAEASRKLRHVIVCGNAGGFITFDALRWLFDTGVAYSQLDWDGAVIIASGPRGPDRSALRRAQVLVCSGAIPKAAVAITREIQRVKLKGQAEVASLIGSTDASAAIGSLAAAVAREADGAKVLSIEARAASIYWKLWENVPVNFTRRNPRRFGPDGRWRPGRPDPWLTFGPRTSLLTGKPFRATTPGNALLNYLYALVASEMAVALLAAGLDPGIGMFHADVDGRSSLAVDAIEGVRPYVDYWLLAYLGASVFANRDFTELSDGEVRITHPLNSHLAHTAALWRKACQGVADWLAPSFSRAAGAPLTADDRMIAALQRLPARLLKQGQPIPPLAPPLPALIAPLRGHRPPSLRGGLKDEATPRACCECGRALRGRQRKFCSTDCAMAFSLATQHLITVAAVQSQDSKQRRAEKARTALAARRAWTAGDTLAIDKGHLPKAQTASDTALLHWYSTVLLPRLASIRQIDIAHTLAVSRSYSARIKRGRMPHPRHFVALAELAKIEVPKGLLMAPVSEPRPGLAL
jgi:CRISPR-associated endonuclease Cas1